MKDLSPELSIDNIEMSDASKEPLAPVDVTMKLDSLENPVKPPIVMYKHINHWDKLKKGLEPADQEIVDRLQKLKDKEKNIPLPTVEEIKRRLALLKDQDPEASGSNVNIHQVDSRTDQEKADDLIQEYLAQLELPSADPCGEIEERLSSLRDGDKKTYFTPVNREEGDTDEYLINRIKAMSTEVDNTSPSKKDEDEDEDEFECVMCSNNATKMDLYRCTGCTGDLYCLECFENNHDEDEMDKHKAVRFNRQSEKS
ncbi:abscission/NoCut checkpoint regulator isoform X2 [Pseudomyrmex gracilis]|nr:abscission/NoCut checkpoint regulator isoform X2 [Pseudomyrmex gracilis]